MLRSWVREGTLLPWFFSEGKVFSQFKNINYIQYTSKTFSFVDSRYLFRTSLSIFYFKIIYTHYNSSPNLVLPSSTSIIRAWKYLGVCVKNCKYLKNKVVVNQGICGTNEHPSLRQILCPIILDNVISPNILSSPTLYLRVATYPRIVMATNII
jgi:hypothetical protein